MAATARLIGKSVVDPNGIELGTVLEVDDRYLTLQGGSLHLGLRFVERVLDKVFVRGRWQEILLGLNAVDNTGEFVGVVKDTVEDGYTLKSIVVEDEDGEKVTVAVENVRAIDDWVELGVGQGDLYGAPS